MRLSRQYSQAAVLNPTPTTLGVRLLLLIVLTSIVWFSLAFHFADNQDFTDQTSRSRINELREVSNDLEPTPDLDDLVAVLLSVSYIFSSVALFAAPSFFHEVYQPFNLVSNAYPRAPPAPHSAR